MAAPREEAAPTFAQWKARIERADEVHRGDEVRRLEEVLGAVGSPMIDGNEVSFVCIAPRADRVELAGEFNEWGRSGQPLSLERINASGVFYRTLELHGPGRFEYKLIIDGEWQVDPYCPNMVVNGIGGQNSWFALGDFREPPELERNEAIAHGTVATADFVSERLGNRRSVQVYMPPSAAQSLDGNLPVLYVHDGGEYLERARLNVILDNLIASRVIPPIVAVMIDPVDRMREYWCNEDYAAFFCDEFIPTIEQQYRIRADRKGRAVMGASLGGLISLYLGLTRTRMFGGIGGQSSAIFLEEERITGLLQSLKRVRSRIYLDVGEYEPRFIPAHERLVQRLKKRRWPVLYQRLAGGHNWTNWRAHLKELLVFLFGEGQQSPSRSRTRSSDGRRPRIS